MEPSCSAVYKANPVYTGAHPVLAGPGALVRAQPVAAPSPELLNLGLRSNRVEGINPTGSRAMENTGLKME